MHGGIGMTDEHDIGLFMKREVVLGQFVRRRDVVTPKRSGAAVGLLEPRRSMQEVDPRRGDRLGAVLLPGEGLDIGDALAEALDPRAAKVSPSASTPPRM